MADDSVNDSVVEIGDTAELFPVSSCRSEEWGRKGVLSHRPHPLFANSTLGNSVFTTSAETLESSGGYEELFLDYHYSVEFYGECSCALLWVPTAFSWAML
jgi:hypothetical protein